MYQPLTAGIELGGTKCVALVARGQEVLALTRVATTSPTRTLTALSDWLYSRYAEMPFVALGIASFGPLGLNPLHPNYGFITRTPKAGWGNTNVIGVFTSLFAGPIGFDTDINGSALAEGLWGGSKGCSTLVYLTIGTGVGGGLVIDGTPAHGLVHPEMGHVRVRRVAGDHFAGACPFHGDCLEGLVSGPALASRTGTKGEDLEPNHPVWRNVAEEIAEILATLILVVSPERILIGGGVGMGQSLMFPLIREAVGRRLQGNVAEIDGEALDRLIIQPALGNHAGPLGAIALGLRALGSLGSTR